MNTKPLYLKLTRAQREAVDRYWAEHYEFGAALVALQPIAKAGELKVNIIPATHTAAMQRAYKEATKSVQWKA